MSETLRIRFVQYPYAEDIGEQVVRVKIATVVDRVSGAPGTPGDAGGVRYDFSTTITDSDPGTGKVRFNNATIGSVTEIYVDNTDVNAVDVTAWLDSFDDSTATVKGYLVINGEGGTVLCIFRVSGSVVDGTGYRKLTVVHIAGALPANNDELVLNFSRTGDNGAGADGEKGGVRYNFSTTVTDSDPGVGVFRFDNATFGSIAFVYIDNEDINSVDVTGWLDSFDDSTSSINGYLVIKSNAIADATIAIFNVTGAIIDGTGYRKIPVTPLAGTVPSAAEECVVEFVPKGDKGDTGATSTEIEGIHEYTATDTLELADAGKLVQMNVGSANNLTVPPNSSEAFAINTVILVTQTGAGQTTLVAGSGVTLRSYGAALKLSGQFAKAALIKVDTNIWDVGGELTT